MSEKTKYYDININERQVIFYQKNISLSELCRIKNFDTGIKPDFKFVFTKGLDWSYRNYTEQKKKRAITYFSTRIIVMDELDIRGAKIPKGALKNIMNNSLCTSIELPFSLKQDPDPASFIQRYYAPIFQKFCEKIIGLR